MRKQDVTAASMKRTQKAILMTVTIAAPPYINYRKLWAVVQIDWHRSELLIRIVDGSGDLE